MTIWLLAACQPGATAVPDALPAALPGPLGGNLVVVGLDDVGIDKIGSYGLNPLAPPTPTLDALAAQGVRFTQAYAYPTCTSTRAALLTGRDPRRVGLGDPIVWLDDTVGLPTTALTLAGALGATHASSAAGKWHLNAEASPEALLHPLAVGFDWYAGSPGNFAADDAEGPTHYLSWQKNTNGTLAHHTTYATTDTIDDALARVAAMPEPWFLYVALNAAHIPVHVPPAELITTPIDDSATDAEKMSAMLEAADTELGRLMAALAPDTAVFVLGDNGTSEVATDEGFDPKRSKGTLFEGGIRVPLFAAGPHVGVPGSTCDAVVTALDLFPTLVELAGHAPLPGLDGRSLRTLLAAPEGPHPDRAIYASAFWPNGPPPYTDDERMVREGRYKLIRTARGDAVFAVDPVGLDEGESLLEAPLDPEVALAHARLEARMAEFEDAFAYELEE